MEGDRPLLSLCLIVRDEAPRLEGCLAAAAGLADEIICVDTGSEDATRQIARAAGARVIEHAWADDFAAARNAALEHARGRWVLFLDADETLEPLDAHPFRQRLGACAEEAMTVEIRSELAEGALQETHIVRLFRNRPEHRYSGRIHEQIVPSIAARLGREFLTPPRSGLRASHSGYLPQARAAKSKGERNERLLRREAEAPGAAPQWSYLLARELLTEVGGDLLRLPRNREALSLLERVISDGTGAAEAHLASLPVVVARLRLALGEGTARAEAALSRLAPALSGRLDARFALGELRLAEGRWQDAERLFTGCLKIPPGMDAAQGDVDPRLGSGWALERVAQAQLAGGRAGAARRSLASALERAPDEAGPRLVLARIAAGEGQPLEGIKLLLEAARRAPVDPRPHLELAKMLSAEGQHAAARKARQTALKLAPGWEDALRLETESARDCREADPDQMT